MNRTDFEINLLLARSLLARPRVEVLNPSPERPSDAEDLLAHLRQLMAEHQHPTRGFDQDHPEVQRHLRELERLRLEVPTDPPDAKAFWINLYNALTLHGLFRARVRQTVLEVPGFFRRFAYRVRWGSREFTLSLDEIEHGVLRGNRAPILARPVFGRIDPRLALGLALDPRIHFTLNCGAKSCPPIRAYRARDLEVQLETASANALQSARVERGTVILPRVMQWYARDFGQPLEFARRYRPDLPARARVRFDEYHWTLVKSD